MADEISITLGWAYSKSGRVRTFNATLNKYDQSGEGVTEGVQSIGFAAHEALIINAEITTFGWAYFKNLNGTNYIEIGYDDTGTFRPFLKLLAGESCVCPINAAPYAQANTGACLLDYVVFER